MALNFTVQGRLWAIDDIQRNYLFELMVPNISVMTGGAIDQEGLIIRTKTASIPSRGNEQIESYFMGMKQFFPGRPNFSNALSITIDETEDQIALKALYAWQQRIFDIDPDSTTAGYSQVPNKRSLCTEIVLRQYRYNGKKLDNDIVFANAWPSGRDDVGLDMTGNEKVTYPVTFTYDFWTIRAS